MTNKWSRLRILFFCFVCCKAVKVWVTQLGLSFWGLKATNKLLINTLPLKKLFKLQKDWQMTLWFVYGKKILTNWKCKFCNRQCLRLMKKKWENNFIFYLLLTICETLACLKAYKADILKENEARIITLVFCPVKLANPSKPDIISQYTIVSQNRH